MNSKCPHTSHWGRSGAGWVSGAFWLCVYLGTCYRVWGHRAPPGSLVSLWSLLPPVQALSPFPPLPPLWVQEASLTPRACPGSAPSGTQVLSAATSSGTLPSPPDHSPPHLGAARLPAVMALARLPALALPPRLCCLLTRPWITLDLGHFTRLKGSQALPGCFRAAVFNSAQRKWLLRRNVDNKLLKEKPCFINERQYCILEGILLTLKSVHCPAQWLAWCIILAKPLDLCVQFPSVK